MQNGTKSDWHKSSKSANGGCVEIKSEGDRVLIRDSKDPAGPVLAFNRDAFREFLADLDGHLDAR